MSRRVIQFKMKIVDNIHIQTTEWAEKELWFSIDSDKRWISSKIVTELRLWNIPLRKLLSFKERMKILQTIQKQYAILGISSSNQSIQKMDSLLIRLFFDIFLLSFGYVIVSQLVYIFHVASNLMEYMESICTIAAYIITFASFVAIDFRKTTLFECIDKIEQLIDTSEWFFILNLWFYS